MSIRFTVNWENGNLISKFKCKLIESGCFLKVGNFNIPILNWEEYFGQFQGPSLVVNQVKIVKFRRLIPFSDINTW
jgi:hypothetical protein